MASLTAATMVALQAPRKKSLSWVPLEAPDSPPLTPPELIETIPGQEQYFGQLELAAAQTTTSKPTVAVIGTGYVGLHLVEAFSTAYDVIAFDVSEKRVQEIKHTVASNVTCVSDPSYLTNATHFLISVSTVLTPSQQSIDISCIEKAIATIATYARPGSTVIIESSVAVGMTRQLLEPLMRSKGLLCGMSPERVDPGRTFPTYETIPKIISGLTQESLDNITDLYSRVFQNIVPVSKPEVAEMTKLYENCQRMMCIAYANEMADACRELSTTLSSNKKGESTEKITIDPWEVASAASTKPFGYQPYTPSLGVGGHCIPVNPYYLLSNAPFPLLEACTKAMETRPAVIGDRIMSTLSSTPRPKILIIGMGFKRGQSVLSNSPGKALAVHLLGSYDVYVEFADPLVEQSAIAFVPKFEDKLWCEATLEKFDSVVVAVDQVGYDYEVLDRVAERGETRVEWFCRR